MGNLSLVSVFSGGMGLDLGLEAAGFKLLMAADNMPAAAETAHLNRPGLPFFTEDVRLLTKARIEDFIELNIDELDLLAGGPPCQSFSTAGRRRSLDDSQRGDLVYEFLRLVDELRPKAFLMENVKGLLSASTRWRELPYNNNGKIIDDLHGSLIRDLRGKFEDLGYSVGVAEINAANYGVPQTRTRVFIIGYADKSIVSFPQPTHSENGDLLNAPWTTLGSALRDLKGDDSYCAAFSERKLSYLQLIPPGGNWRNLPTDLQRESMGRAFDAKGGRSGYWRRLSFDRPSPTILTEPQNASTTLCHPLYDRPLTVRECARIQTFPDTWRFAGRGRDQYILVGNAVPVDLGTIIGEHVKNCLTRQACEAA